MTSEIDQDAARPALSWESVTSDPSRDTPPAPASTGGSVPPPPQSATPPPPPPPPVSPPAPAAAPQPVAPQPTPAPPIDLAIPPLSLDALPPIAESPAPSEPAAPVLGAFHLDLNAISEVHETAAAPEPQPTPAPIESIELRIAPLDMPDITPSGPVPTIEHTPAVRPPGHRAQSAQPASVAQPTPAAQPVPVAQDVRASTPMRPGGIAAPAQSAPVAHEAAPIAHEVSSPVAAASGLASLPSDPVSADPTPTTVIETPIVTAATAPALPTAAPGPAVTVPEYQPNQASAPRVGPGAARAAQVAPPVETSPRKKAKQTKKAMKAKQKQQKKKQKSGGSGIALFFTLLVLAAIIAGAIVFGRPYLFPEKWDADAQPYGEAIETVRGVDFAEQPLINRTAAATYSVSMADQLLGDWETDLPMWRSLALAKDTINEVELRALVANWTPAYYSPATGEIVANADLPPVAVDGAITEAMALAAIDQESPWSSQLDPVSLDSSALIQASAIVESLQVSNATSFGAALHPERRLDVAAFLPPVLEYRVNAPQAYSQFAEPGLLGQVDTGVLPTSQQPELAEGDVVTASQQQLDRTFWYMVFASYNTPSDAYAASNALVQASLATVDRSGVQCSYATFSGTDVAGTEQLTNVLQTWVAAAPAEMSATTTALPNGTLQFTSCDPGAGFETSARFGVAREIVRWRTVELAALENVDPQTGTAADRVAAIQQVRESEAALPLMAQPFDTPNSESARMARAVVFTAAGSLGTLDPALPEDPTLLGE